MSITLNSGHDMPLLGLGTSSAHGNDLFEAIGVALETGYRLIDTAVVYGNQKAIGDALEYHLPKLGIDRSEIFVTTKIQIAKENCQEFVEKSVHQCLEELKLSYIDLILIHYPNYDYLSDEALIDPNNKRLRIEGHKALLRMQANGLIRSTGVSNYVERHIQEIEDANLSLPAVNQIELHPHFVRKDLQNYCKEKGVFVQAFSSLASCNDELLQSETVSKISSRLAVSPTAVLLAYPYAQRIGVIPKSVNTRRIKQNLKDATTALTPQDILDLDMLDKGTSGAYVPRCIGWTVI